MIIYKGSDQPPKSKGFFISIKSLHRVKLKYPCDEPSKIVSVCKWRISFFMKKAVQRRIYNFEHANWEDMNLNFNSTNWRELLENCPNVESDQDSFKIKLFDICNANISKTTISNEFQQPWFDSEVYTLSRKNERFHEDWKDTNSDLKYMKFSRARAEYKKLVDTKMDENFHHNHNRNLINKRFWAYVKAKSNSHRIPEVLSYNDRIRLDPQGQCELFNEYFANQFSGVSNYQVDIDFSNDHLYRQ